MRKDVSDASQKRPVSRIPKRVQPRQDSAATRERILDCAERLFAQEGYHASSLRHIASAAQVQVAMVGYHFGSKADLLDSVIARRIELLNSERIAFLQNALAERKGAPVPLRLLLEGYVGCMIFRASLPDAGWRNYAQLVAALANSSEWTELTARHFNEVAELYLREFQRSLPGTPPEDVYRGFFFAVGTMVAVCSRPGRIETLSKGKFKSEDVSRLRESLCDFLEGGFKALRRH